MTSYRRPPAWSALLLAMVAFASGVRAGEATASRTPWPAAYRQECAACHVAFPPALLPAQSWQRLMANLPRHFGTDASLDPANRRELGLWLTAHAATGRRAAVAPAEDRITRSAWFVREHGEVPAAAFGSKAVKGAADCAACHAGANQGVFDEHDARVPR